MAFRYIRTPESLFMQNRSDFIGTPNSELKSSYSHTSTVAHLSHNSFFQALDVTKMIRHKIQKNVLIEAKKRIKYYVADRISGIATQQAAMSLFPSDQSAIQPFEKQFDESNPIYSLRIPSLTKRNNIRKNITQFMTSVEELKYKEVGIRRQRIVKVEDVEKLIRERMNFSGNFSDFYFSKGENQIEYSLAVEIYNPINVRFRLEQRVNWAILKNKFEDLEYIQSIQDILVQIHQIFSSEEAKKAVEERGYYTERQIRELFSVTKGQKKQSDIKET
mgnify:CR=1 FL=1